MKIFGPLLAAGVAHAYTVTTVDQFMLKNIDPLVLPGQYTSHMHSFFGSDAVNATTSTSAELRQGCSTARNPNDFSVYWVPTLYLVDATATPNKTHTPITPMRFSAYYELLNEAEIPLPENFHMVIGNASATSSAGLTEDNGISWACEGDDSGDKERAAFPETTCSTHLQFLLFFPDCANPDTFETAYSKNPDWFDGYEENRCPAGMYRIPRLRFSIRYDLREILPNGWDGRPPLELACGNEYCAHGDFINGWLTQAAEDMLNDPSKREYYAVTGPLGTGDAGSVCGREARDADPGHGTGDYVESLRMMNRTDIDATTKHKRHYHAGHRRW